MKIPYVLIMILALGAIFVSLLIKAKKSGKKIQFTPMTPISVILIACGAVTGERAISYSLFGLAVIIAIADSFIRAKKSKEQTGAEK